MVSCALFLLPLYIEKAGGDPTHTYFQTAGIPDVFPSGPKQLYVSTYSKMNLIYYYHYFYRVIYPVPSVPTVPFVVFPGILAQVARMARVQVHGKL